MTRTSVSLLLSMIASLAVLGGCGASLPAARAASDGSSGAASDPAEAIRYDEVIQASSHNAFEREEPLLDQLVYDRIRSLELDIHPANDGTPAPAGEWFVFHEDIDVPGFRNSSCATLSDCLGLVSAFHRAVPEHEVVTIWIDLKGGFTTGHMPEDLDADIAAALGRENVVTPAELLARCPSATNLRDAVAGTCRFPSLAELRGRFIVAVTGGTSCNTADAVPQYGGASPIDRLAFLAPGTDSSCPVSSYDGRPDVVFLNMVFGEHARVAEVRARGLVARVYRGLLSLNNADDFGEAKSVGTNHIAFDMLNFDQDPWASTHSATGFPFECDRCGPPLTERAAVIGVRGTGGDVGGSKDAFFFAHASDSGASASDGDAAPETWTALVSVPSSHVDAEAKGCLVARASDAADAASVALCRAFDQHAPSLIVRPAAGTSSSTFTAPTVEGFRAETAAFLRLTLQTDSAAGHTIATASTSVDGIEWSELARVQVDGALPLRGLGVAGHSSAPVKALFVDVTRERGGATATETLSASSLADHDQVGDATGTIFDGIFP